MRVAAVPCGGFVPKPSSQWTLRWREPDSNHRSRPEQLLCSRVVGHCHRWRAEGSAFPGLSAAGAAPHSLELLGQFRSGGGGAEPFGFERTATLQFVDASAFHGGLSISRAPQQVSTSSSWKPLLFQGPRRIFTLPGAALQAERPSPGWLGSAPRRSFPIPGRSAGPPRKGGRGIFICRGK